MTHLLIQLSTVGLLLQVLCRSDCTLLEHIGGLHMCMCTCEGGGRIKLLLEYVHVNSDLVLEVCGVCIHVYMEGYCGRNIRSMVRG